MIKKRPETLRLTVFSFLAVGLCALVAGCVEPQVETVEKPEEPHLDTENFNSKKPQVLGAPVAMSMKEGFKTDEVEFTIAPKKGLEYMLDMKKGATLFYSWTASSDDLRVDFHGHPKEAGDYPKGFWWRYASLATDSDHGKLETPLEGLHGWYFGNRSQQEITIKLRVAGDYRELKRIQQN